MSTSLLYHAFGVRGYRYVKTKYVGGEVIFTIEQPWETCRCSACGSENVIGRGKNHRRFRAVPIGGKPVYLELPIPRVECRECNVVRQVEIGFADPRVTYTKAFARYALELSQYMTIQDVADHLRISWDVIKEIQKADLKRRFDRPKLKHLRHIAIDEISTAKGHVYLTLVLDLDSGVVVHVGSGKGGDALKNFWIRLRALGGQDRGRGHGHVASLHRRSHDPSAEGSTLVFDRFHVIKLYNDKLSELRRAMHRELKETMHKDVLKGVRWLLLKRPENLDPARKEPQRLEEALRLNAPLATAYYLKAELNEIWEQDDEEAAQALLMDWITYAEATGIQMLQKLCQDASLACLGNPRLLRSPHIHRTLWKARTTKSRP